MGFLRRCAESLIELENHKEVKKVKKQVDYRKLPYFELKVVKVKKRKKCKHEYISWEYGKEIKCLSCGRIFNDLYDVNKARNGENPKGNWVNGENLDKIKFPCFCTHKDKKYNYTGLGIIIKGINDKIEENYKLIDIGKQHTRLNEVATNKSLKELIDIWNIHILKGKIIIFEEEE